MKTKENLSQTLQRIDQRGYKAYKDITGGYSFEEMDLYIDHVQSDPFATPSKARVRCKNDFNKNFFTNKSREIAFRDYLTRQFSKKISQSTDNSQIRIAKPNQEILERTSVIINENYIEVRFRIVLPAFGRRIAGKQAQNLLLKQLPDIAKKSLFPESLDTKKLDEHVKFAEDADFLRNSLNDMGIVAFVANNSILPRKSSIDNQPMQNAVPFESPEIYKIELKLPNRIITGMGIPKGITLIVGGGYHGKSTLLNAIEHGVYNHIPGDGREFVVSTPEAVKIRAEDGRSITGVNISPFIEKLPLGKDTKNFSSMNASGSTSQAANIMEALELGCEMLLIDEDTSATNFMIRDSRMQELVPKNIEPITPFIDKARPLYKEHDVSTILVIGGSGSYFDIADNVICMIEYQAWDMTSKAKEICERHSSSRKLEGGNKFGKIVNRIPDKNSIDAERGGKIKIKSQSQGINFGKTRIDLASVEQMVEQGQTIAIGEAIYYARAYMDHKTLSEVINQVMQDIKDSGLDVLTKEPSGEITMFRKFELAAALNRLTILRLKQVS